MEGGGELVVLLPEKVDVVRLALEGVVLWLVLLLVLELVVLLRLVAGMGDRALLVVVEPLHVI